MSDDCGHDREDSMVQKEFRRLERELAEAREKLEGLAVYLQYGVDHGYDDDGCQSKPLKVVRDLLERLAARPAPAELKSLIDATDDEILETAECIKRFRAAPADPRPAVASYTGTMRGVDGRDVEVFPDEEVGIVDGNCGIPECCPPRADPRPAPARCKVCGHLDSAHIIPCAPRADPRPALGHEDCYDQECWCATTNDPVEIRSTWVGQRSPDGKWIDPAPRDECATCADEEWVTDATPCPDCNPEGRPYRNGRPLAEPPAPRVCVHGTVLESDEVGCRKCARDAAAAKRGGG